ncbi:amino acid adenylation domain-containing protein (plasmid) [Clostridium gasigenes]|uniref:non-ribosomal peptide synthetase n=1 Tax=Clostridium gasigenes TaxID=94869 RepID=UPI001A924DF6|nr:non-ribosomal peptide synthetase [Clostridium gasigenes]QSW21547.1 amino acid adenylation domain-containing protein [Clostridium gasigenes]
MIPTYYIYLNKMPLTNNGKIDKRKLPEVDLEALINNEYEEPRNKKEEILVSIWKDVLGSERIGINDNFFDLGGDSIKAIRIVSKLQGYGYKLEVKEIFEKGTIKNISYKIVKNEEVINQEEVSGEVLLTPIQKMFFEEDLTNRNHWNQSIMLHKKDGFDKNIISRVFKELIIHHDALRMVYKEQGNKLLQVNRKSDEELFSLKIKDLIQIDNYEEKIKEESDKIQKSIDLENGPLVKLGLFNTKDGDYLLIVIHHLVIDGVSWRILNEDFARGYHQVVNNEPINFQEKTHSFKEWADYLYENRDSEEVLSQKEYWEDIINKKINKLPYNYETKEKSKIRDSKNITISISKEETNDLLKNVNRAYSTEINDVLLTALTISVNNWTKEERVLINLEGHGREVIGKNIDVSRTIGWFTSQYPLLLEVKSDINLGNKIKEVKEKLRHVPKKGIGYGILRYMNNEENLIDINPEISFNYLGEIDEEKNDIFNISNLNKGNSVSLDSEMLNEIDINGIVAGGKLSIDITYNSNKFNEATISDLAQNYKNNLINIIEHCKNKKDKEATPSDYSCNDLTIEELSELQKVYERENNYKIKNIYNLTPMQEGMLFHALIDEKATAYFEQTSYIIEGNLDIGAMNNAFNMLIEKYDVLRTVIAHRSLEKPRQVVLEKREVKVYYEDISNKSNIEIYIKAFEEKDRNKTFNLSEDVLMRLSILKIKDSEYKVLWSTHHILTDGWSAWILMKDFFEIYSCIVKNEEYKNKETSQYVDYINWLEKQSDKKAKSYWKNYLENYDTKIKLPTSIRSSINEYKVKEKELIIDVKTTSKLKKLGQDTQSTINIIIQSIWGTLLQKYNNTTDSVFGTVVSGRDADIDGIENMVGLFINTIPVRVSCEKDITFKEMIKELQEKYLESSQYSYYPLSEIQSLSEVKGDLITSKIAFQNYYVDDKLKSLDYEEELGFKIKDVDSYEETNYDLNLKVVPGESLNLKIAYNANAFNEEDIDRIKDNFNNVILEVIKNNEIKISQIEVISEEERNKIICGFSGKKVTYNDEKTLQILLEESIQKSENKIAIEYNMEKITYKELNEKSNQVARMLRGKGIKQNSIVGLVLDTSIEMVVGMLGIIKAGAAYLPIDPKYPKDRIEYIIKDSKVENIFISNQDMKIDFDGEKIYIYSNEILNQSTENLEKINSIADMAYVIYTSGSTGNSKGVVINQSSLLNYYYSIIEKIEVMENDETALLSSYAFDLGYTIIFTSLLKGIKLNLLSEDMYREPKILIDTIKEKVTYIKMTPSMFNMIINIDGIGEQLLNSDLRLIILGGEEINIKDINKFKEFKLHSKIKIINHYGPTESTIGCITTEIDVNSIEYNSKIIGKPLNNIETYIFDNNNKMLPIGAVGELCIGGKGLAREYLNREELTKEKFISNPYIENGIIYKTGDLARYLLDGNIEFLGRIDDQVKIRGFRIELGEIEKSLLQYDGIEEAIVIVNEKELCAYYIANEKIEAKEIRVYLKEKLPNYMIPLYYVQIDKIPLTSNGKIDKKSLKTPDINSLVNDDYEAPRNESEEIR